MEYKPIARSSEIVVQEIGGETLVYDLKNHKAKCLNETSAMVWKHCDGTNTAIEITMALSAELKTKVDESLVFLAFDQLQKEELLEPDNELVLMLGGTSRRELIKKVGFATIVALPVVSSVVAPMAAHAQSITTCTPTSGLLCECGTGNGTPDCVDAAIGLMSTRAGGGPCTTNDVSCVANSCGAGFPNGSKCCVVLTAPACQNGAGGLCCE